ncbi:MAG: hypothetical protein HQM04_10800 [Magnetococcales bacterium]|nr:hypothetical protein [Magnetococcales bacterium]MBF0115512.1 hypothetical protein [Magnetococcales bacterium]
MMDSLTILKWIGTATGVLGALLVALHIPQSGYGFLLFLVSSTSWFVAAYRMREFSLMFLQGVFTVINLIGVWRWLFTI